MTEVNKQNVADALAIFKKAKDSILESAHICAEEADPISEILKMQPIEVTVGDITVSVKVKGANAYGGRKGRSLIYQDKTFPSAKSLCEHLSIDVRGDSAVRKLAEHKIEYTEE